MQRQLKSHKSQPSPLTEAVHFRLCHVCLFLNESNEVIAECEACRCEFVSDSAFDRSPVEPQDDDELEGVFRRDKGLNGLAVVW